jgi:hypothetical protein
MRLHISLHSEVTLSLHEWNQYVSRGYNILYGSVGVIPGGTTNTLWRNGTVYKGRVR